MLTCMGNWTTHVQQYTVCSCDTKLLQNFDKLVCDLYAILLLACIHSQLDHTCDEENTVRVLIATVSVLSSDLKSLNHQDNYTESQLHWGGWERGNGLVRQKQSDDCLIQDRRISNFSLCPHLGILSVHGVLPDHIKPSVISPKVNNLPLAHFTTQPRLCDTSHTLNCVCRREVKMTKFLDSKTVENLIKLKTKYWKLHELRTNKVHTL